MTSGIVLIDKPQGITSHDAVYRVRRILGTKKVGHAGTLDPMASGLLVLGFNASTRLLHFLVGLDKQYIATFRLGASTTTDDAEGEVIAANDASRLTASEIDQAIENLTGVIQQIPSSVSAIKINGKKAYELARAGEEVELKAREVEVKKFQRSSEPRYEKGFVDFDAVIDCTSGTYIRALARDLGNTLGVGGHLTALRRTKVGEFSVESASSLENENLAVISPETVAGLIFPTAQLSLDQARDLVHGKRIYIQAKADQLAAIDPAGDLLAILQSTKPGEYKSMAVFPKESK